MGHVTGNTLVLIKNKRVIKIADCNKARLSTAVLQKKLIQLKANSGERIILAIIKWGIFVLFCYLCVRFQKSDRVWMVLQKVRSQ